MLYIAQHVFVACTSLTLIIDDDRDWRLVSRNGIPQRYPGAKIHWRWYICWC